MDAATHFPKIYEVRMVPHGSHGLLSVLWTWSFFIPHQAPKYTRLWAIHRVLLQYTEPALQLRLPHPETVPLHTRSKQFALITPWHVDNNKRDRTRSLTANHKTGWNYCSLCHRGTSRSNGSNCCIFTIGVPKWVFLLVLYFRWLWDIQDIGPLGERAT